MAAKKHCHNCRYLEYAQGEEGEDSGWVCDKRIYGSYLEEDKHFNLLDRESYRMKGKRCFEPKDKGV